MEKKELLLGGGAEELYSTGEEEICLLVRKDSFDTAEGTEAPAFPGKGAICARMSNHLHRLLSSAGVETAFVEEVSDTESLFKKCEILPFRVVVRNYSAGHLAERTGLKEGAALLHPALEFRMKKPKTSEEAGGTKGEDVMVNGYDLLVLKRASEEELAALIKKAFRVNEVLTPYFQGIGINLIDCSLQFGRVKESLVLTGTLSPDTMRLWDAKTSQRMDMDRFRRGLGNVEDAYREVFSRLKIG